MKVHELITRLQNFDMYLDVKCLHEDTTWVYDEDLEQSVEIDCCVHGSVAEVNLIERSVEETYIIIK